MVFKLINVFKATPLINELETGHNILHLACLHRSELRYYFAKHFPSLLRNPDSTGAVPLHLACLNNDIPFVQWLFRKILSEESEMDQFCISVQLKRSNSLPDIPKGRPIRRNLSSSRKSGSNDLWLPVSLVSPMASIPFLRPTHRRVKSSGGGIDLIDNGARESSPLNLREAGLLFSFDSTSSSTRSNTVSWHSSQEQSCSIENSYEAQSIDSEGRRGRGSRESSQPPRSPSPDTGDATPLPPPITTVTNGHSCSRDDPLGLDTILAEPPLSVNEVVEMKPFRVDMKGNTVLHILASEGHAQLLGDMLKVADYIKRSVNFELLIHRDNARLPIEMAIQSESRECVRMLVHFAILAGLFEELLKDTLILKTAVFTGDMELVKVLIEFGFTAGLGPAIALAMVNENEVILRLLLFYHTQVVNSLEYSRVRRNRQVSIYTHTHTRTMLVAQ